NVLRRVTNSTRRLRTESTDPLMRLVRELRRFSSEFWIERVAQPVAEQVDRKDQPRQRKAREGDDPPLTGKQIIVADPDQGAERGHGVGHAGSEKRQRRLGDTASARLMVAITRIGPIAFGNTCRSMITGAGSPSNWAA